MEKNTDASTTDLTFGQKAVGITFNPGGNEPPPETKTCKDCEHRERHQFGGSVFQYCGVRPSNRTTNGLLKIKCKTPACHKFEKIK